MSWGDEPRESDRPFEDGTDVIERQMLEDYEQAQFEKRYGTAAA